MALLAVVIVVPRFVFFNRYRSDVKVVEVI